MEGTSNITVLSDLILKEEGVDGSQSDQLESKITGLNTQRYKIVMPQQTETVQDTYNLFKIIGDDDSDEWDWEETTERFSCF